MNNPIIEIENLSIGYRNRAGDIVQVLRQIDLSIVPGKTIGLVGESGSSKSTVALSMMGYLRSGSELLGGSVKFHKTDLYQLSECELEALRGKQIALIPQNAGNPLTPTIRIGTQFADALRLHSSLSPRERSPRTIELLSQVRLPTPEALMDRYPHQLSGGQQQRVAIVNNEKFKEVLNALIGQLQTNLPK
ncbi:ATP-binding cassette domain-containing protein [Chloroflexi bacterium TSY]|nr:ATP-binding cassette domain-containing protein [Chloroflexi bacterium TSY]